MQRVIVPLVTLVIGLTAVTVPGPARAQAPRPNIILLLLDDLDAVTVDASPRLRAMLHEEGTAFSNAILSIPACCPSRASILRGQYVHNHGVKTNRDWYAGFHQSGREEDTLATWLAATGYRTMLLGKYMNRFPGPAGKTFVPPGWAAWRAFADGAGYYDYTLNEDGALVAYGSAPEAYSTDVLARHAEVLIRGARADGVPFYLHLAPYAPHSVATPARRHASAPVEQVERLRTPDFNEEDVSDKPPWIRDARPLSPSQLAEVDAHHVERQRTMMAVEDMLERLLAALSETGQLERTYIFFTTDNGYHLGEHRLRAGKRAPYETDVRAPFVVRGPAVARGRVVDRLVSSIDLAPTFAELADAPTPPFVDGRSILPLLGEAPPPSWRRGLLAQNSASKPRWTLLRTETHAYIEYATGEAELYDLAEDPHQLTNLRASTPAPSLQAYRDALASLRACAGASCRSAEDSAPTGALRTGPDPVASGVRAW